MLKNFDEIIEKAKGKKQNIIAVAVAQDIEVLKAIRNAKDLNIADAILIGNEDEIKKIALDNKIKIEDFKIINIVDNTEACKKAVSLITSGNAHILMKGLVDTSIVLKSVLDNENGLKTENVMSHVSLFEIEEYNRFLYITDGAMNISPNLKAKKQIIENAVKVANVLGNKNPKVGILCAVEKINPKMQATIDAVELVKLNKNGELRNCEVGGPFALDNAISIEAAKHKGIDDPMAGKVDILLVPNIEVGNVLHKSIVFLGKGKSAGLVMGAKVPIIMTSRADSDMAKLQSIALSILVANGQ